MDNNELKRALLSKEPVIYKNSEGIEAEYKCVSGVIYRERGGSTVVTAEIKDKNDNSVTICNPKQLRFKEGETN